jgi:p-aminobenzoyl-glutamate transporter AbgT
MKLLSKEMLINAGATLVIVMVALYVHDKYVAPKLASGSSSDSEA